MRYLLFAFALVGCGAAVDDAAAPPIPVFSPAPAARSHDAEAPPKAHPVPVLTSATPLCSQWRDDRDSFEPQSITDYLTGTRRHIKWISHSGEAAGVDIDYDGERPLRVRSLPDGSVSLITWGDGWVQLADRRFQLDPGGRVVAESIGDGPPYRRLERDSAGKIVTEWISGASNVSGFNYVDVRRWERESGHVSAVVAERTTEPARRLARRDRPAAHDGHPDVFQSCQTTYDWTWSDADVLIVTRHIVAAGSCSAPGLDSYRYTFGGDGKLARVDSLGAGYGTDLRFSRDGDVITARGPGDGWLTGEQADQVVHWDLRCGDLPTRDELQAMLIDPPPQSTPEWLGPYYYSTMALPRPFPAMPAFPSDDD